MPFAGALAADDGRKHHHNDNAQKDGAGIQLPGPIAQQMRNGI